MDTTLVTVVVLFRRTEMDTSSQTAGHLLTTRHMTIVSQDIKEADNSKKKKLLAKQWKRTQDMK